MKRVNIKYLIASLILILSLTLGTSCSFSCASPRAAGTLPPPSSPATHTTAPINPTWTPPSSIQNPPLPDFISVVAEVKPSVVAINTEVMTFDFWGQPFKQEGAGSGWIIDEDGYIVTNNHVVEGADNITGTLEDDRTFPASIIGTDWLADLAVLKIDAENLVKVSGGDSFELEVGEWVVAIGNSLGLGVTPSEGIVRCLGASIPVSPGQTLYDLIGTSAPINPGNSGGPLVNMRGEVVGITSVKIAMVGVEGMGWATSINSAMPIITELINKGYVVRPYLGISYRDVSPTLVWQYDLVVAKGIFIVEVIPGSPAADEARLKPEDVIVGFDGKEITNTEDLMQAITSCEIGQRVEITYWRGKTKNTTYATLTGSPPP